MKTKPMCQKDIEKAQHYLPALWSRSVAMRALEFVVNQILIQVAFSHAIDGIVMQALCSHILLAVMFIGCIQQGVAIRSIDIDARAWLNMPPSGVKQSLFSRIAVQLQNFTSGFSTFRRLGQNGCMCHNPTMLPPSISKH